MSTLSDTLTASSKSPLCFTRPPLLKLVLEKAGQTTRTFNLSTTNMLINVDHVEQEWSQIGHVAVQADSTLAALDLSGYQGVLSYGYNTGVTRTAWVKNTGYSLGDIRIPTSANVNGYQY